ncbi:MAG: aminotransferase class V-fold PLP-dependent enzyme [Geodermatophilaceae bacterium]|nr:aminotransferase class V-fold PLP-dependent enzyme [Geodermatophilaceae bacterium]
MTPPAPGQTSSLGSAPHVSDEASISADRDRLDRARAEFDAEVIYLNTTTMGLPPRRSLLALQAALNDWRRGTANPLDYDVVLASARASYAELVSVDPSRVAVGSQVSVFAGLVAASLPPGSDVLTAAGDFTSILFPFHAQAGRGVTVREVPLERLADAVTARTALVSVSAVQSADGRVADLDALQAACAGTGTKILLDTTQAVGWLPINAGDFAYTVCGGYKWLLAPRGTAFFTVHPDLSDALVPNHAGWYAGQDRWSSIYGTPLRLAADARRFDLSPAWHSWVGAAPALALLNEVGLAALHTHGLGLAERFRSATGLPSSDSAIVSVLADDLVPDLMSAAGIVGSERAGRLRLSFHVSTSEQDTDRAAAVLAGHLRP